MVCGSGPRDRIAIVSVTFPDLQAAPNAGHIISPAEQEQLAADLELITCTNSYGRYEIDARPDPGEAASFRITMPPANDTDYYWGIPIRDRTVAVVADVVQRMRDVHGIDLETEYERVAYYFGDETGAQLPHTCNLASWPFSLGAQQLTRFVSMTHNIAGAAGIAHEIEHTYDANHASCWRSATRASALEPFQLTEPIVDLEYGDPFDFMGLGQCCVQRFSQTVCSPSPPCPVPFAPMQDIHVHPVRKLQQGWLRGSAFRVVTAADGPTVCRINGISTGNGVVALEIPRGQRRWTETSVYPLPRVDVGTNEAQSIFVYYRDNEPKVSDGASISFTSKQRTGKRTKLVRYTRGPLPPSHCAGEPVGTGRVACEESSLRAGEAFHDPVTRATLLVCEVNQAEKWVDVAVAFPEGVEPVTNDHTPVVNLISPTLEQRRILTDTVVDLDIEAYDPDFREAPRRVWDNIHRVRVFAAIVGLPRQEQVFHAPFEGDRLRWTFDVTTARTGPVQRLGSVNVEVWTRSGERNTGKLTFVLDNRGPFSW